MQYVILGAVLGAAVLTGMIWYLIARLEKRSLAGGASEADKERLEELAKHEKKAAEIKARPEPIDLAAQLAVMRERLRKKVGRDGD